MPNYSRLKVNEDDRGSSSKAVALGGRKAKDAARAAAPCVGELSDVNPRALNVVPATEVPEAALLQFYRQAYPERADFMAAHWRWLYRIGEYDWAAGPWVTLDGDEVVAHFGRIPVLLQAGDDVRRAFWDVDLAVLPAYQGRKIGTELLKVSRESCPLHVAFANEKSTGTASKVGWRLNAETHSFQLLLRPELHPKFKESALASVSRVAGLMTRLAWSARTKKAADLSVEPISSAALTPFSTAQNDGALHVVRSSEFWDWRLLRHPLAAEHCILRYPVNASTEYTILARCSEKTDLVTAKKFRRVHLLSLVAEPFNQKALSEFFASIVRWCLETETHRVLFVTSRPFIAQIAQTWFPITSSLRFLAQADDADGRQYLFDHLHHWECLDSDFDLAA